MISFFYINIQDFFIFINRIKVVYQICYTCHLLYVERVTSAGRNDLVVFLTSMLYDKIDLFL